jgi:hypothetical protein
MQEALFEHGHDKAFQRMVIRSIRSRRLGARLLLQRQVKINFRKDTTGGRWPERGNASSLLFL